MNICRHPLRGCDAGGMINRWLWPRLTPGLRARVDDTLLLGCGGLIDVDNPALGDHDRIIVFGAGARGANRTPDVTGPEWDIRFVRGPETARVLGLGPERWLCDPAVLAPALHGGRGPERRSLRVARRVALIPGPHVAAAAAQALAAGAGLSLIPMQDGAEAMFDALIACDAAICGDLIGAVIADAYGIPWRPLRSAAADDGDAFEWLDWSRSMALTPCAIDIPHLDPGAEGVAAEAAMRVAIRDLDNAMRCDLWSLSDRSLLRLRAQALTEELADLQARQAPPRRSLRVVAGRA